MQQGSCGEALQGSGCSCLPLLPKVSPSFRILFDKISFLQPPISVNLDRPSLSFPSGFTLSQATNMAPSNSGGNFAATTVIAPTLVYLDRLRSLVPSTEAQKKTGYVTERLTQQELQQKKRCIRCRARRMSTLPHPTSGPPTHADPCFAAFRKTRARKPRSEKPRSDEPAIAPKPTSSGTEVPVVAQVVQVANPPRNPRSYPPSCSFHTGHVLFQVRELYALVLPLASAQADVLLLP